MASVADTALNHHSLTIEWYDIKVVLCSGVVGYLRYSHLLLNGMTLKLCCVVEWLVTYGTAISY